MPQLHGFEDWFINAVITQNHIEERRTLAVTCHFQRLPQERNKSIGKQAWEKGGVSGEKAVKNGLFQLRAG
jgi:hypothetical protein